MNLKNKKSVIKIKNLNGDKTQKLKWCQNSKTKFVVN